MNEFYPGQRVVCLDDTIKAEHLIASTNLFPQWVTRDKVYKVRAVMENDGIATGLLLQNIHNPPVFIPLLGRVQEPAFAEWRFAPLIDTADEMEVAIYDEDLCAA